MKTSHGSQQLYVYTMLASSIAVHTCFPVVNGYTWTPSQCSPKLHCVSVVNSYVDKVNDYADMQILNSIQTKKCFSVYH